jgi:hypothetical protein
LGKALVVFVSRAVCGPIELQLQHLALLTLGLAQGSPFRSVVGTRFVALLTAA